jgi:hypothetical protein
MWNSTIVSRSLKMKSSISSAPYFAVEIIGKPPLVLIDYFSIITNFSKL